MKNQVKTHSLHHFLRIPFEIKDMVLPNSEYLIKSFGDRKVSIFHYLTFLERKSATVYNFSVSKILFSRGFQDMQIILFMRMKFDEMLFAW